MLSGDILLKNGVKLAVVAGLSLCVSFSWNGMRCATPLKDEMWQNVPAFISDLYASRESTLLLIFWVFVVDGGVLFYIDWTPNFAGFLHSGWNQY